MSNPLARNPVMAAGKKPAEDKKMTRQERALAKKAEEEREMMLKKAKKAAGKGKKGIGGKSKVGGRGKGVGVKKGSAKKETKKEVQTEAPVDSADTKPASSGDTVSTPAATSAEAPTQTSSTPLNTPGNSAGNQQQTGEVAAVAGTAQSQAPPLGTAVEISEISQNSDPAEHPSATEPAAECATDSKNAKPLIAAPVLTPQEIEEADMMAKALIDAAIKKRKKAKRSSIVMTKILDSRNDKQADDSKQSKIGFTMAEVDKLTLSEKKKHAKKLKPPPGFKKNSKPPPPPPGKLKAVPPPPPPNL